MHFCCPDLILVTLIKQTNTTLVNLRAAFICFILCDTILSSKVFSRFLGQLSVDRPDIQFLQKSCEDQPASQSLWNFHRKQGRRRFSTFSQNITKEENLSNHMSDVFAKVRCARTRNCYAMPILLCFSDVFLHFKNVFISHVWEVNNCTA